MLCVCPVVWVLAFLTLTAWLLLSKLTEPAGALMKMSPVTAVTLMASAAVSMMMRFWLLLSMTEMRSLPSVSSKQMRWPERVSMTLWLSWPSG